tara:strand:- start:5848 stop:8181 length:2334 start_codon:yes stop_codon:yes gene_type:complete
MDRDVSYRGRISQKVKYTELNITRHTFEKKNKDKSWEFREYSEFDVNFICISKDGTLGDIRKVGDLYIGLPSQTIDGNKDIINDSGERETITFKKHITNGELSDYDAKWVRKAPPIEFKQCWSNYKRKMAKEKNHIRRNKLKEDFVKERNELISENQEFVDNEFHYRKFGLFIKVDNEVHYMTGENWLFLKHYYLTESNMFPFLRVVAMESYWHWEACRADSRTWGEIRGKGRRTSWSVESASMALNVFTIIKDAEIPIVSERKDLAGKLFKGKIVKSFKYYPIYFKPLIDKPNTDVETNLQISFETDDSETSTIDYYPTKDTAYDSLKVKNISINDEIGKWKDESLTEFVARHSRCHLEGDATGRFGSTAGSYSDGGGEEFEAEFLDANVNERNSLGRTENGLTSFFIDVCYTMTQPISYFDAWGYSVVFEPVHPIENEQGKVLEHGAIKDWQITYDTLKAKGKKTKLNAFLRDMPRTIEHMFRNEGGVNNDFDIQNLNDHEDYLANIPEYDMNNIIFRGNFAWKGDKFTSDVEWLPNTRGKFFTTWIPEPEEQNKGSVKDFHGKRLMMPDNNHIGCLAVDPYDISKTADGIGSDGSIVGKTKNNFSGAPQNSFFLKYTERPDKRDDFYEDVLMACKFFGMYALVESNKPRLLEFMKDNGYRGYSMTRPDKKWSKLSQFEKDHGGIPASTQLNEDVANLLKDYIFDFIGHDLENECRVYFIDMIREWVKFDVKKRKKFDLTVAGQLALLGCQYNVKQRNPIGIQDGGGVSFGAFGA